MTHILEPTPQYHEENTQSRRRHFGVDIALNESANCGLEEDESILK
jgi:hypothetical protein